MVIECFSLLFVTSAHHCVAIVDVPYGTNRSVRHTHALLGLSFIRASFQHLRAALVHILFWTLSNRAGTLTSSKFYKFQFADMLAVCILHLIAGLLDRRATALCVSQNYFCSQMWFRIATITVSVCEHYGNLEDEYDILIVGPFLKQSH